MFKYTIKNASSLVKFVTKTNKTMGKKNCRGPRSQIRRLHIVTKYTQKHVHVYSGTLGKKQTKKLGEHINIKNGFINTLPAASITQKGYLKRLNLLSIFTSLLNVWAKIFLRGEEYDFPYFISSSAKEFGD